MFQRDAPEFAGSAFEGLYKEVEEFFYRSTLPVRGVTLLMGLVSGLDTVELEPGVTIEKIDRDAADRLALTAVSRTIWTAVGSQRSYAMVLRKDLPKEVGSPGDGSFVTTLHRKAEACVQALSSAPRTRMK